jgi:quercetin dioxygenase-like cupin family protein
MTKQKISLLLTVLMIAAAGALAIGQLAGAAGAPPQAKRADLAAGQPRFAPGYGLSLMRVVIRGGVVLAPHRHPGMQTARVISGRLRYRVFRGKVPVYRGPADGSEKKVRTITAGHTAVIEPGQWIVENPGVWHAGSNPGKKPTVILIAALLKRDKPISIPATP